MPRRSRLVPAFQIVALRSPVTSAMAPAATARLRPDDVDVRRAFDHGLADHRPSECLAPGALAPPLRSAMATTSNVSRGTRPLNAINYQHLLYFWTVAREGSIARATAQLNLTQPTISGQLRTLERALGERLLVRHGRGMQLTEMGRTVFRFASSRRSPSTRSTSSSPTPPSPPGSRFDSSTTCSASAT